MDGWNVLIFGVIPVFSMVVIFSIKRKLLWTAPVISTTLAFITYMIAFRTQGMHTPVIKIFSNNEWRAFFILAMLIHLGIVIFITVIASLVEYILKQKKKK